ncbi:MAG: iron-sulfur cluster assembly accessory protein [Bacteriovoracaceae bacterium]|jgi:iron-sulfur cluster assembly protein|nr:iron-sulfur cluster assembly accessory protein [Bacteriovoracaceae bacterium]
MSEQIVTLTEKAIERIAQIVAAESPAEGKGLRLGVVGGGCSGLSYKIEFSEIKDNDFSIKLEGIQILIDPKSAIYLKDVTLDFQDGLEGKGFVFENPNAKNTCGCGESFTV